MQLRFTVDLDLCRYGDAGPAETWSRWPVADCQPVGPTPNHAPRVGVREVALCVGKEFLPCAGGKASIVSLVY
jgi:hypothetical protein